MRGTAIRRAVGTIALAIGAAVSVTGMAHAAPAEPGPGTQAFTYYEFVARHSSKCMTVSGTADVQYTCLGTQTQQWRLQYLDSGYYLVIDGSSGKCLTIPGDTFGKNAAQSTCNLQYNQNWKPVSVSGGYYRFEVRHTGMCLTVDNRSQSNNIPVQQEPCGSGTNQQWLLR